jgi:hypothetical protein
MSATNWCKPAIEEVFRAVEVYLQTAYAGGKPPTAVMQRLETLRNTPAEGFFECPVFERDAANKSASAVSSAPNALPTRYAIRLGNKVYPHMKIVIEPAPHGGGHLFRADTHDRHIRPSPESREYKAFCELMEHNQSVAEAIETEWARSGLPTFRQFLRADLANRARATQASQAAAPAADAARDRPEGTS